MNSWRVGIGYDIHPVVKDKPLRLGGLDLGSDFGLGGHTDGDVVLHALIDAMFGAAGLPDIGEHFPDHAAQYKNRPSTELLSQAYELVQAKGWSVNNVDVNILAERPKLGNWKSVIRNHLASLLKIEPDCVSIKAKTNERFDAIGQCQAIAAQVVISLVKG